MTIALWIAFASLAWLIGFLMVAAHLISELPPLHPDFCDKDCRHCSSAINLATIWPVSLLAFGVIGLVKRERRRRESVGRLKFFLRDAEQEARNYMKRAQAAEDEVIRLRAELQGDATGE